MTIRELANYLGVHFDDDDPGGDTLVDRRLFERITFLLAEFNKSQFVIDDDEPIEVIADLDESKNTQHQHAYSSPQKSFVGEWRSKNGNNSNVLPIEIHPNSTQARKKRYEESYRLFMEGRDRKEGA